jgi:hypothetical protein
VVGLYQDATDLVTPQHEEAIDRIAADMPDLHVARFDVRYESLGAMQAGEVTIIHMVHGGDLAKEYGRKPPKRGRSRKRSLGRPNQVSELREAVQKTEHRPSDGREGLNWFLRFAF